MRRSGGRTTFKLLELGALHDVNTRTAKALADQYGVPARLFETILDDPGIVAVGIADPAEMHGTLARCALQAPFPHFVAQWRRSEPT